MQSAVLSRLVGDRTSGQKHSEGQMWKFLEKEGTAKCTGSKPPRQGYVGVFLS